MRSNFPLAFGIPASKVPPEVWFYCSAPWNLTAFKHVQESLLAGGFDPIEAVVRSVPKYKQAILREAMTLAISSADHGPDGMRAAWYTYHFLPLLHEFHSHSSDEAGLAKSFQPADVERLRAVANRLNWNMPAVRNVPQQEGAALPGNAPLLAVSQVILSLSMRSNP